MSINYTDEMKIYQQLIH